MRALKNKTNNKVLVKKLLLAKGFFQRMKGLIGCSSLGKEEALWIPRCNSIHTFFMSFPIDVLFVDYQFKVLKTYEGLKPWRLIPPVWKAQSVIEMPEGFLRKKEIHKGDELYVES